MGRRIVYSDTPVFHYHNENPKNKITCDCVVRAIATATGKSWDDVLEGLFETARQYKLMLNDKKCYERYLAGLGWRKNGQPRRDDNTKYTGAEFCEQLQEDPWVFTGKEGWSEPIIVKIGCHHVACIKDGRVWDSWDSSDGCIGNYWTKD